MTKQVVTTLKMMPVSESVAIRFIGAHIAEDGTFQGTEGMAEAAGGMLDEIARFAEAPRPLREPAV